VFPSKSSSSGSYSPTNVTRSAATMSAASTPAGSDGLLEEGQAADRSLRRATAAAPRAAAWLQNGEIPHAHRAGAERRGSAWRPRRLLGRSRLSVVRGDLSCLRGDLSCFLSSKTGLRQWPRHRSPSLTSKGRMPGRRRPSDCRASGSSISRRDSLKLAAAGLTAPLLPTFIR
jgi:hypothetical protein